MIEHRKPKLYVLGWLALLGCLLFLSFNKNSRSQPGNYRSELWADKSGYYIYLPAFFIYGMDSENLSEDINKQLGLGVDKDDGRIHTKYYYGVSVLQLPFFLATHIGVLAVGGDASGFSKPYYKMVNVAGVFYGWLGLLFCWLWLKRRGFTTEIASLSIASILLATNLYYYTIDETGMSHVYSFALFTAFLLVTDKLLSRDGLFPSILLHLAVGALILVIRPTNAIFLAAVLFMYMPAGKDWHFRSRLKWLFQPVRIGTGLLVLIVAAVPQLLYWKYLSGSPLFYSYANETFNWTQPHFLHHLFSTKNGLIVYTPFMLVLLVIMALQAVKSRHQSRWILPVVLVMMYVFSSWYDWAFGCSFGQRSYVEWYALMALPVAGFIQSAATIKRAFHWIPVALFVLLAAHNIYLSYKYPDCWFGGEFDWPLYLKFFGL